LVNMENCWAVAGQFYEKSGMNGSRLPFLASLCYSFLRNSLGMTPNCSRNRVENLDWCL
jgi:hypothetical protein